MPDSLTTNTSGVVGEARAARLLYLALTSRLLQRPVSVVVKGPSAAGKSFLVERVLVYFPPSAYYALSAMSERALAYSEEPLRHRFLVIYEATGLQGEFQTYLVRSLLSEGRVRYETVEKTKDGLRPRLIEREGPTGFLATTTAVRLHHENETRVISVTVRDTPEQTRSVMLALAEDGPEQSDHGEWHAFQRWLAEAEHRVFVPFARELARAVPPVAVRLRRDFGAILNLIRAHAVLHQAGRERDSEGRIIATVEDYAAVHELVADLVAEGVGATVPDTIRETVAAVEELAAEADGGVTVTAVARKLGLDKSAAWRRVRTAVERGYLKNLEAQRGRAARLVLGEPLPEEVEVLPPVDSLEGCGVAANPGGISTAFPSEPRPDQAIKEHGDDPADTDFGRLTVCLGNGSKTDARKAAEAMLALDDDVEEC